MSRRKQEKPQQRKFEDGEEGDLFTGKGAVGDVDEEMDSSDVLICGECQTEFQLDDIVRFIRHKVHKCNKENIPCHGDDDDVSDDESRRNEARIAAKRPSISAPIGLKSDKTPQLPMNLSMDADDARVTDLKTDLLDLKKSVDADTNTVNSEPYSFLCGTCKSKFDSAWMLVQHAQSAHGMKIYVDAYANTSSSTNSSNNNNNCTTNNNNNNTISRNKNDPQFEKVPSSPLINGHRSRDPPSRDGSSRGRESRGEAHCEDNQTAPAIVTSSLTNGMAPVVHPNSRGSSTHSSPIKAPELPHHPGHLLNMEIGQPPNPFMFRMPLGADRQPLSPMNGPFRPPGPMDFLHDPFHRMIGMPPRLEAPHPPGMFPNMMERPRPGVSLNAEQPMDFYSQRLRRLAGTTMPAPEPESPNRRQTPPFSAPNPSTTPTSTSASTTSMVVPEPSEQLSPPLKERACDFCGKQFRFQSNLIVHRRSHTGEKPFKCTLCSHACTQASKLKRHMRTHSFKTPFGTNFMDMSRCSTPDSTGMDKDESSDEEEEEEEMDMDEVEPRHPQPTDLSSRKSESSENGSDDVPVADRQALLAEVMEKSGLSGIQAYNEAFQQALAENLAENNNRGNDIKDVKPLENGLPFGRERPERSLLDKEKRDVVDSPFRFNPHTSPLLRHHPDVRVKMENDQHMANMDALYSNIWFPPTANPRDVFMGGPMRGGMDPQHPLLRHAQNGGPPHSAFLESLHPPPGLHRPPGLIPHAPRPHLPPSDKKNNRTDMCEFCGKVFKNCSNLTVHRRSHTGEKPYRCELCSYACAQSSKLTRHMRTHCRDGKDVYRCKFCNMPFSVPSTLEKHMRKCVENHNLKMDASSISSSPLSMDATIGLDMSMAKPSPSQSV